MSFTQCMVQLFSSVAPGTPCLIMASWERVAECTLKAHWLSSMSPINVRTASLLFLSFSLPLLKAKEAGRRRIRVANNSLIGGVLLMFLVLTFLSIDNVSKISWRFG